MKIRLPLKSGKKSPPFSVLEVKTLDYTIVTAQVDIDIDRASGLPSGLLRIRDLYGNSLSFSQSRLLHIVNVCATEVRTKTETYYIVHPHHIYIKGGELVTELTVIQKVKEGKWHPLCYKYENKFSI